MSIDISIKNSKYKIIKPAISVIVPIYNAEDYLEKNVISYENQTFDDFELILVDDGATDNSREISERVARKYDNITVALKKNGGLSSARNAGVSVAQGEYLFFIDPDDTMEDTTLYDLYSSIKKSNSDIAIAGYNMQHGEKYSKPGIWIQNLFSRRQNKVLLHDHPEVLQAATAWGKLFKTDFYIENHLEFVDGILYEDQPFTAQAYVAAKNGIDVLEGEYIHWLQRDTSISHQVTSADLEARFNSADLSLDALKRDVTVQQQRLKQYLNHDFRFSLLKFGLIDSEFDDILKANLARFLTMLESQDGLDPMMAVAYHYLNTEQYAALSEFIAETGLSVHKAKLVSNRNQEAVVDWSTFNYLDEKISETLPVLGEVIQPVAEIFDVNVINQEIEIDLVAFLTKLNPVDFNYDVKVEVVKFDEKTGMELANPIIIDATPLAPNTSIIRDYKQWWVDYSRTLYRFALPTNLFKTNDTFKFNVIINAGNYTLSQFAKIKSQRDSMWKHFSIEGLNQLRLKYSKAGNFNYLKMVPYAKLQKVSQLSDKLFELEVSSNSDLKQANLVTKNGQRRLSLTLKKKLNNQYSIIANLAGQVGYHDKAVQKKKSLGGVANKMMRLLQLPATYQKWELELINNNGNTILVEHGGALIHENVLAINDNISANADVIIGRAVYMESVHVSKGVMKISIQVLNNLESKETLAIRVGNKIRQIVKEFEICDGELHTYEIPLEYDFFGSTRNLSLGKYQISAWIVKSDEYVKQNESLLINPDLIKKYPENIYEDGFHKYQLTYGKNNRIFVQLFNDILDEDKGGFGWGKLMTEYNNSTKPIESNKVLLTTYYGETAIDSALAIYYEIQKNYPDLDVYWAVKDPTVSVPKDAKKVIVNSREYFDVIATSGYFIENNHQVYFMKKKPGQVIVEAFHGYPYKLMGSANYTDNLKVDQKRINSFETRERDWDYLISPAPYATPLYQKYFDFHGQFIEEGYPRNDIFFDKAKQSEINHDLRDRLGIRPDQKVVLYAPTHREANAINEFQSKRVDFVNYYELSEKLGDNYVLLIRAHAMAQRTNSRLKSTNNVIDVTDYPDINDLIAVSDMAVLDYSSLRFDYAQTRKPMIFLIPDIEEYEEQRPGLFPYAPTAPGPWVNNLKDLKAAIENSEDEKSEYNERYKKFISEYTPLEDGHAAVRVAKILFGNH